MMIVLVMMCPSASAPAWFFDDVPMEITAFLTSTLATRTQAVYGRELGRFLALTPAGENWSALNPRERDTLLALYLARGLGKGSDELEHVSVTEGGYALSALKHTDPFGEYKLANKVFSVMREKAPQGGLAPH